jgi:hypothetical protein
MTKRTVPAPDLILATLDLGRPDSHAPGRNTGWFRTLRGEGENRRAHTEGDTQEVTERTQSGTQMGKAKTKRLRRQLPSERVPIALVAVTRLTMMLSVRSGLELQGEGKRETGSLELWSPDPKRALSPWWRSRSRDYGHLPGSRAQAAGESRTDAHAKGQGSTLHNSVQRKRPGQPSLARPGPATPRPCQDHTPTRVPPPETLHYKPRLVPGSCHIPGYGTFLRQGHPPTMATSLIRSQPGPRPHQDTPCHVLASMLLRLRGAFRSLFATLEALQAQGSGCV